MNKQGGAVVWPRDWIGRQQIFLVHERDLGVGIGHVQELITRRLQKVGEVPLRKGSQGVRSLGLSTSRGLTRFPPSAICPGSGVSFFPASFSSGTTMKEPLKKLSVSVLPVST